MSAAALVLFMVLYPVGWLCMGSLRTEPFTPDYTLAWYVKIFTDEVLWQRLMNTLFITVGTGIMCLLLGVPMAWIVARTNTPFRRRFELIAVVPFMTAPLIGAIAWINLAAPRTGLLNLIYRQLFDPALRHAPLNVYSLWGIIFSLGLYYSPYVFLFTSGALRSMDPALEEASRPWTTSPSSSKREASWPFWDRVDAARQAPCGASLVWSIRIPVKFTSGRNSSAPRIEGCIFLLKREALEWSFNPTPSGLI
jgi:iron(III) transport system permease protein